MIIWVLYDIEEDKARKQVFKFCQQANLHNVQLSCFLGTLEANDLDTLKLQIEEVINEDKDKVYIFPMNKAELKQTIQLGQAFDKKKITNEIKLLFI
jgi:CRISPR-associated protein Cas2